MPSGVYERTEETKLKISINHADVVSLMRKGRKRLPFSKDWKKNISISKKGKWLGENNPNWKGGITSLMRQIRNCFKYRQWRSDVFTRDDFTYQNCGDKTSGNLNAHHIKPFAQIIKENKIKTVEQALNCEELWNINNGLTLCKKCHSKIHNYKSRNKRV